MTTQFHDDPDQNPFDDDFSMTSMTTTNNSLHDVAFMSLQHQHLQRIFDIVDPSHNSTVLNSELMRAVSSNNQVRRIYAEAIFTRHCVGADAPATGLCA